MPKAPRAKSRRSTTDADTEAYFTEKLASSGLTPDDAAALGLYPLTTDAFVALAPLRHPHRPALVIPYFDAFGEPMRDLPTAAPFARYRVLGPKAMKVGNDGKAKDQRYFQPHETAPCIYLPRTVAWADYLPDPDVPLIITEGELKAAKAASLGFPAIGLGGVWNWRSTKMGVPFARDLEAFAWLRRNVYLIFDSDLAANPNVLAALEELCYELQQRGALPHVVWLPEVLGAGAKVGLDDFLLFHGDAAEGELRQLLAGADLIGLVQPLFELNKRFVYVANPGLILDLHTDAKHKPGALKEHLAAPTTVMVKELVPGGVRYKRASAGAEWLKWPLRTEVGTLTYAPGKAKFIRNGRSSYNLWPGWGVEPAPGSVKPFLDLLDHLFRGAEPAAREWALRWLAYPLQHPGTKLFTSMVIHGRYHGTGKSLLAVTMGRIYGENYTTIKQRDLEANHNEWAQNKQFVLGDDVTGSDKRHDADILKTLITQEKVRVNPKFIPSYEVPDCINYFFTSNQPDSFYLEDNDRRFFVHEVKVDPLDEMFYVDYGLWLDSGGASHLFHYLLQLDLGDFNPAGKALATQAKTQMIADVRSDLASWVRQLMADPDQVLRVGGVVSRRELMTNKELLMFYDPTGKTGTTANGLGRELRRAGVTQALDGQPLRAGGAQDRYYIVRQPTRWVGASREALTAQLESELKPAVAKAPKY